MVKREISVDRNDDGTVYFCYPKEWSGDKLFEEICELCADLQKEAQRLNTLIRVKDARIRKLKQDLAEKE